VHLTGSSYEKRAEKRERQGADAFAGTRTAGKCLVGSRKEKKRESLNVSVLMEKKKARKKKVDHNGGRDCPGRACTALLKLGRRKRFVNT